MGFPTTMDVARASLSFGLCGSFAGVKVAVSVYGSERRIPEDVLHADHVFRGRSCAKPVDETVPLVGRPHFEERKAHVARQIDESVDCGRADGAEREDDVATGRGSGGGREVNVPDLRSVLQAPEKGRADGEREGARGSRVIGVDPHASLGGKAAAVGGARLRFTRVRRTDETSVGRCRRVRRALRSVVAGTWCGIARDRGPCPWSRASPDPRIAGDLSRKTHTQRPTLH